ncbi:MAG: hypothetical protein OEM41_09765 [Ignavibacteria bacterium]|nr:hypothetical protein [Ignavibacteria bacterium]
MKTISCALLLMAGLAFVVVGCSDNSTPIAGQALSTAASSGSLAKGGILNSATGSAHWKSIPLSLQSNVRWSFSAIRHADGSVSGEVQDKDEGPTFSFHGKVTDLKVQGNIARLEFVFTRGTYFGVPLADFYGGDLSNVFAWVVVVDNGEGNNASGPDYASGILWGDDAELQSILGTSVEEIRNMEVDEFNDWIQNEVLPFLGLTSDDFFLAVDKGSIQVR